MKALGLRPRAFICFSVFGTRDKVLALVFDILLLKLINKSKAKDKGNHAPWRVWISDEKLLVFASLISPSKSVCLRSCITQTLVTVFHYNIKNLEVRQKYSATRRVFNSLLGRFDMWWNDETLCLVFDILLLESIRFLDSEHKSVSSQ